MSPSKIEKSNGISAKKVAYTPAKYVRMREEKIALIGAGPAGMTAGHDLAKAGYDVTLYEADEQAGVTFFVSIQGTSCQIFSCRAIAPMPCYHKNNFYISAVVFVSEREFHSTAELRLANRNQAFAAVRQLPIEIQASPRLKQHPGP